MAAARGDCLSDSSDSNSEDTISNRKLKVNQTKSNVSRSNRKRKAGETVQSEFYEQRIEETVQLGDYQESIAKKVKPENKFANIKLIVNDNPESQAQKATDSKRMRFEVTVLPYRKRKREETMTLQNYNASDTGIMMSEDMTLPSCKRNVDEVVESPTHYAPAAKRMMTRMGYQEGKGLGSSNQGIIEPVKASIIKGRRGVGAKLPEALEPGPVDWDFEEEVIIIEEKIDWIRPLEPRTRIIDITELRTWLNIGPKKLTIDDEFNFVDSEILNYILRSKSMLDSMEGQELFKARSRSNPFETIKKGIFINRAAMKMANIDAIMGSELSDPKTKDGAKMVKSNELLYFADVCAGPGGFSEYILWKKQWFAKGFGFTLKGDCDFKLDNFVSGPPESFEPHYGIRGDGDIYSPENVKSFTDYVLSNTDGLGVHFMMADGVLIFH